MTGFDSIQVRFKGCNHIDSPLTNTRVVPFVGSYFEILKAVVNDVNTEYFWFFANFVNLDEIDLDFIPEQHQKHQIHVWYTTHPMGGLNKEGNVMLIPTQQFKEQMYDINFLRDFKDINYHPHPKLYQQPIPRTRFKLRDPYNYIGRWTISTCGWLTKTYAKMCLLLICPIFFQVCGKTRRCTLGARAMI